MTDDVRSRMRVGQPILWVVETALKLKGTLSFHRPKHEN